MVASMGDHAKGRRPSDEVGWKGRLARWDKVLDQLRELCEWSFERTLPESPHVHFGGIVPRIGPLTLEELERVLDEAAAPASPRSRWSPARASR